MIQSRRSGSDDLGHRDMEGQEVRAKRCSRKMRGIENSEERGIQIWAIRSRAAYKSKMETKSQV
jgi:hypothetical protein